MDKEKEPRSLANKIGGLLLAIKLIVTGVTVGIIGTLIRFRVPISSWALISIAIGCIITAGVLVWHNR